MSTRQLPILAAALSCIALLAGCGGSSGGDRSTPVAAVKTYLNAIANGDGNTACGVLAPDLRGRVLSSARAQGAKASSCADLISQAKSHITPAEKTVITHAKVSLVSETGNTAVVKVGLGVGNQSPTLTKVGGNWEISSGVGA